MSIEIIVKLIMIDVLIECGEVSDNRRTGQLLKDLKMKVRKLNSCNTNGNWCRLNLSEYMGAYT